MKKSFVKNIALITLLASFVASHAFAAENRVRAKISTSALHGTELEYDSKVALTLDFSHAILEHVELGVSGTDVFLASGANLYSFSFNPAAFINVDLFHFYAGPLIGGIIRREDTGGVTVDTSTMGLGGFGGVDFEFLPSFLANVSIQYIGSTDTPTLSIFSLCAGVGYTF